MDIQKRIKNLLDQHGWSVYHLAQKADIPQTTLSNLFNRYNEPTISTLELICKGFGITLSQFFADEAGVLVSLTPQQKEMLDNWGKLDQNQRQLLLELMKSM